MAHPFPHPQPLLMSAQGRPAKHSQQGTSTPQSPCAAQSCRTVTCSQLPDHRHPPHLRIARPGTLHLKQDTTASAATGTGRTSVQARNSSQTATGDRRRTGPGVHGTSGMGNDTSAHINGPSTHPMAPHLESHRHNQSPHVPQVSHMLRPDEGQQHVVILLALVTIHCRHCLWTTKNRHVRASLQGKSRKPVIHTQHYKTARSTASHCSDDVINQHLLTVVGR